ncbi:1-acyl-sn-glycerol-3-phosphate acyltransferase [Psittacicella gerlachiana]|uniref:Glycerol-3-phosphate acyltransferase n=1 Tax=Psittacicella gerlachiana TaxID=2028574 RepID=A0A3A1YKQ9_9GAMM|nr:1-acyl-sn-glycerol-3-phosphate acyltransferase [Psittacicella gerlachiana]RIY38853.1 hypothetical protein CKF59_00185 [Psittacicella gerlachiana]
MSRFLFKLTRLRDIVHQDVTTHLNQKQNKVVYVLPYDSKLALEALFTTVEKHKLPWQLDLLTHNDYDKFNHAPVLFLNQGDYITAESNPSHPQLEENLRKLYNLGEELTLVLVYPQWGTNIITKPSLSINANPLSKLWLNLKSFLKLRKFSYLTLYAQYNLRDLTNLMLSSEISRFNCQDLNLVQTTAEKINQVEFLTDLADKDLAFLSKSLAAYLRYQYQATLARRNSNIPKATRKEIMQAVISQQQVQEAISKSKKEKKDVVTKTQAVAKEQQVAQNLIEEIAADPRFSTLKKYDYVLKRLWNRFYSGITIRGLDNILDTLYTQDKVALSYVATHRSHIDYLLLSYIMNEYGAMQTPLIAAGINLNFWPVGKIFRRGGAFFLRRSFNNYLYSIIFKTYLAELIKNTKDTEFFIEGGRSRTGRLLTPKTGMLNMMLSGYLKNQDVNQFYVPIFIAYDKVFESKTYVQELQGKKKNKESALLVLKNLSKLKYQGQVHVNFARPLSVKNYFNQYWPSWQEDLSKDNFNKAGFEQTSNALARDIAVSINANATISDKALFSAAIFNSDAKLNLTQLKQDIEFLQHILKHNLQFNPGYAVCQTPSEQIIAGVVKVCNDNVEKITPEQLVIKKQALPEFNYYRNNIEHCFIAPALAAIKLNKNISDAKLQGFCDYFTQIFNLNSFTNFTEQSLMLEVKYFEKLLEDKTLEQRNLLAKQLDIYLMQLDTFMSVMVEALQKLQAEDKGIESLQLSTITPDIIARLKEVKSIYPDFADKTTVNQLRSAFAGTPKFANITADQLVEALAYIHTWLK